MSEGDRTRRMTAEIDWGKNAGTVVRIGQRPLHQYWPVLAPYFRDLLLPPQRRSGDEVVAWTWLEDTASEPVSSAELAALRERLTANRQWFADSPVQMAGGEAEAAGARNLGAIDQLQSAMAACVTGLVTRSDDALAAFVCRTRTGLRLHSWGAAVAARPYSSDGCGIAGTVLIDQKPAENQDVRLETEAGKLLAQTSSGRGGAFAFQKINPGRYRIRVRSDRADFSPAGQEIDVGHESVAGLEFKGTGHRRQPAAPEPMRPAGPPGFWQRIRPWLLLPAVLAAGIWGWNRWDSNRSAVDQIPANTPADRTVTSASGEASSSGQGALVQPGAPTGAGGGLSSSGSFGPKTRPGPGTFRSGPTAATKVARSRGNATVAPGGAVSTSAEIRGGVASALSGEPGLETPSDLVVPADAAVPALLPGNPMASGQAASGSPDGNPNQSSTRNGAAPVPAPSSQSASPDGPIDSANTPAPPDEPRRGQPRRVDAKKVAAPPAGPVVAGSSRVVPAGEARSDVAATTPDAPNNGETAANFDAADTGSTDDDGSSSTTGPAETDAEPAGESAGRSAVGGTKVAGRSARENKYGRGQDAEPPPSEPEAEDTPPAVPSSPAGNGTGAADFPAAPPPQEPSPAWRRPVRMLASPGRVKLVRDDILPTQPVPVGADDGLAALRARLLQEHQARLPAGFQHPVFSRGVVFDLGETKSAAGAHWHVPPDCAVASAQVAGAEANIRWTDADPAPGAVIELLDGANRSLGRITFAENGAAVVETVEGIAVWQRIEIVLAATAGSSAPGALLRWQTATGRLLPSSWRQPATAPGSGIHRLDVPLQDTTLDAACALVEPDSGWALTVEIDQRPAGQQYQ